MFVYYDNKDYSGINTINAINRYYKRFYRVRKVKVHEDYQNNTLNIKVYVLFPLSNKILDNFCKQIPAGISLSIEVYLFGIRIQGKNN